jgi:putative chitinase
VKLLHKIFPKHFNPYEYPNQDPLKQNPVIYETTSGSKYANPEKLFNYIYSDSNRGFRYKLGNTSSGDGFKYRGRGLFQLTGKSNYQQFNSFYKKNYSSTKDFVTNPNEISSNIELAVLSALWYYNTKVKITVNRETTVEEVTNKINGGENGIKARKIIFNLI